MVRGWYGWLRPMGEGLRRSCGGGVVGRRLKRDVERDFDAMAARRIDEAPQIRFAAKLGMYRLVTAGGGTDCPRTSRLAGSCDQRIVAAFALRAADGMDRRQVQDVEPHVGH